MASSHAPGGDRVDPRTVVALYRAALKDLTRPISEYQVPAHLASVTARATLASVGVAALQFAAASGDVEAARALQDVAAIALGAGG